jgi:hypothetical protein
VILVKEKFQLQLVNKLFSVLKTHQMNILKIAGIIAALFVTGGCKKNESGTVGNNSNNNNTGNNGQEVVGVFILQKVRTTGFLVAGLPGVDTYSEGAACAFVNAKTPNVNIDAGTIQYNNAAVAKQSNNFYANVFTSTDSFPNLVLPGKQWNISGNTTNGISALTVTAPAAYPSFISTSITTSPVITKANGHTISWNALSNCDSVRVSIGTNSVGTLLKTVVGSSLSCSFSAAELSVLGAATPPLGNIQIDAFNRVQQTISGKKIILESHVMRLYSGVTIR